MLSTSEPTTASIRRPTANCQYRTNAIALGLTPRRPFWFSGEDSSARRPPSTGSLSVPVKP
jgi:hypothetical protein